MSMKTLESTICVGARLVLKNPRLRVKDIQEWSTGDIEAHDGEVVVRVTDPGVSVAVKKECDRRKGQQ